MYLCVNHLSHFKIHWPMIFTRLSKTGMRNKPNALQNSEFNAEISNVFFLEKVVGFSLPYSNLHIYVYF